MPKPEAASNVLQEVDNNFIGFNSRLDPSNLQPGFAQASFNMRLQRGTAQPRKGCSRLTDTTLNNKVMVGAGNYVDANGQDNIVLVFTDSLYLYNTETATLSVAKTFPTQNSYTRGIVSGGIVDVVQALGKLYIFRGQETETRYGTGGTSTTCALNLTHATVANGATVTVTATWVNSLFTTYALGDEVTIFNITDAQHSSFNNTFIVTQVTGTTSFQFSYTNNTGSTITASGQPYHACVVKVKPPLIWDGVSNSLIVAPQTSINNNVQTQTGYTPQFGSIPPSDFGLYFQNRIVCKISNNEIVVSDILSENFDFTLNNFIINQGGNDTIVGVLPWVENNFLVFMAKSIFIAFIDPRLDPAAADMSQITVVTTQIGCLSRKSIVSAGQFVLFLSGKGVHMLSPQLDLKLIGNTLPLSEPIDDFFDNVNFQYANKSVSSYYDNRFFIAIPTGSSTRPDKIIVYNTLNQAWETIDTYPTGMYIDNIQISQYGQKRRMFILTNFAGSGQFGGIFLTEQNEGGDQFSSITGTPVIPFTLPATITSGTPRLEAIDARLRSRQYTFDTMNEKRFLRAEYQFNNSAGNFINLYARTHDPDVAETILAYQFTGSATTDSTLRPRIALRGACMDMEVQFITGRPALKSAALYAITANRNMISEE
jgi:hypothetical protein